MFLGGKFDCEIDETHLFTQEINVQISSLYNKYRFLGIFERGTKRVYLKKVSPRNSQNLFNIVQNLDFLGT